MPSSYSFITFSDVDCMRNKSTKTQIRKHAMKDIGFSRRRSRGDSESQLPVQESRLPQNRTRHRYGAAELSKAAQSNREDHLPLLDDRALYSPDIRALSCAADPFDTKCTSLDSATVDLLKYFEYYSSQMPTSFVFTPDASGCIRTALTDALVLSCMLSAAASRACYVHGLQLVHFKQKEVACTQQGLETLQERVKVADNELSRAVIQLIVGVLYLGAAALYRDDPATAKVHVRFAIKLAEQRGGVAKMPDPLLAMRALGLDDLLSCREWVPCSVRPNFDPGPSPYFQPEKRDEQVRDEECSASLLLSNHEAIVPDSLRELICQILGTLRVKRKIEEMTSHTLSGQALGERQWLVFRTLAIRNRLLESNALESIAGTTNALRIALVLFTLLPPREARQARTAQLVAKRLRLVLCEISGSQRRPLEEIRFWCLLMGYFSVSESPEKSTEAWFKAEICKIVAGGNTALGISGVEADLVEELIRFQRRCLFHESQQRPMTEQLAIVLR